MSYYELNHVGIIMDGNRRWAKSLNFDLLSGYSIGADNLLNIVNVALEKDIKYLSCFVFSYENWKRSEAEILVIKKILADYLLTKAHYFLDYEVKFRALGDYEVFGNDISDKIKNLEEKTKHFTKLTVSMFINYSSRMEILKVTNDLIQDGVKHVTEDIFRNHLYTSDIPDPDLIIRTGNEYRLSNFLLWQAAYAELYFSKKMWPDFSADDFKLAITDFYSRERRKGK